MTARFRAVNSIWWKTLGALALALFIFVAYASVLSAGFFGSDFEFLPLPAQMNFLEYLNRYFNPWMQNMWYHPFQGIQWWIEYALFGSNAAPYHLAQVLQHIVNAWLLFALVGRITREWRAAFVAGLVWAMLPTFSLSVQWPANPDPLEAIFYLLALHLWWSFLQRRETRFLVATILAFISALLTKEIGVTLPFTLFLLDRLVHRAPATLRQLIARYAIFVLMLVPYGMIEYIVQTQSRFTRQFGWGLGVHLLNNALFFFQQLVFPWGIYAPWTYIILVVAAIGAGYLIVVRHNPGFLFIVCFPLLTLGPIIPFPSFQYPRYLYTPLMATATLVGIVGARLWNRKDSVAVRGVLLAALGTFCIFNWTMIQNSTDGFAGLARLNRLPFRLVAQRHPDFEAGTYVYFISPPTPTRELSAMFYARYGTRVTMTGSDENPVASLRQSPRTLVVYYEGDQQREEWVEPNATVAISPTPPIRFDALFALEGIEIVKTKLNHKEPLIVFLYWRATEKMDRDYVARVRLVSARGDVVMESAASVGGDATPTSTWSVGQAVADARIIPIPADALPGKYRLEIELFDGTPDQPVGSKITLESFEVEN